MSSFEGIWAKVVVGEMAGVNLVQKSLHVKAAEGEDVGQLVEKKKGFYSKELEGWLLDFRSLSATPLDSSGRWLNVEGDFAVFTPTPGLQMTTEFRRVEEGKAICLAKVRVFLMPLYL